MIDRHTTNDTLRRFGWLVETPPAFTELVLSRSSVSSFDKGEWLYRDGETGGGLWGVADGGVHLESSVGGKLSNLALYAAVGFWTGEASLITNGPRVIGLRAARSTIAYHLSRHAFRSICEEDPEAWRWVALLAMMHSVRLLGLRDDLMIRSPEERVVAVLARMSQSSWGGPSHHDGGRVEIEFSQEALAESCNVSRTLMATVLARLKQENLIELGYRRLTVLDIDSLNDRHRADR